MIKRIKEHVGFGVLLNLLVPGTGHLYWRDFLFGAFVFLVMLIASIIFFFGFLVDLPALVSTVLLGVSAIFYAFTFVDLVKVVRRRSKPATHKPLTAWLFLFIAIAVALLLPLSPLNFAIRNRPTVYVERDNAGTPTTNGRSIYLVDRAAYRVNLFFLKQPYEYDTPARWDRVLFRDAVSVERIGRVIGYGGEAVAFFNDSLFVDGSYFPGGDLNSGGHLPLTRAEAGTILVATLNGGAIGGGEQVSLHDVIGKAHRLF